MTCIAKQVKQILLTAILLLTVATAWSQAKPQTHSKQLSNFNRLTAEAGLLFTFPDEFRETPVISTEDFPFDYAISLPGKDFEIWFMVRPPKKYPFVPIESFNADSTYNYMAEAQAKAFTGGGSHMVVRSIPK